MQVDGLISNTYILAIVAALVFVGIAILISSMIAYQGGKNRVVLDNGHNSRRRIFLLQLFLC